MVSTTDTPHNVIIKNLEALGCYEGAFVPSIDFENLCIDYVDKYTDFSWVSVNLKGTVAYVEIQEKKLYGKVSMGVVRTTFIIDENGNIEKIMPKVKPDTNAAEILAEI